MMFAASFKITFYGLGSDKETEIEIDPAFTESNPTTIKDDGKGNVKLSGRFKCLDNRGQAVSMFLQLLSRLRTMGVFPEDKMFRINDDLEKLIDSIEIHITMLAFNTDYTPYHIDDSVAGHYTFSMVIDTMYEHQIDDLCAHANVMHVRGDICANLYVPETDNYDNEVPFLVKSTFSFDNPDPVEDLASFTAITPDMWNKIGCCSHFMGASPVSIFRFYDNMQTAVMGALEGHDDMIEEWQKINNSEDMCASFINGICKNICVKNGSITLSDRIYNAICILTLNLINDAAVLEIIVRMKRPGVPVDVLTGTPIDQIYDAAHKSIMNRVRHQLGTTK